VSDEQFTVGFRGNDEGFGAAARAAVGEIGKIRTAINQLPANAIRGIGAQMAAVFSVDYLANQVRSVVEFGSSINDMSQRVGASTDFMQKLAYAGEKTGTSLRASTAAFRELQRSQVAAVGNRGGEDANAFRKLGISVQELRSMNAEDLWVRVGNAIENGTGNATELSAAMALLGRSGSEVLPMLREGFSGLAQEAVDFGTIIDSEVIEQLDDVGDRFGILAAKAKAGFAGVVGSVISMWEKGVNFTERIIQGAITAYDARKDPEFYKGLGGTRGALDSTDEAVQQMQQNEEQDRARTRAERRARAGRSADVEGLRGGGATASQAAARPASDALQRIGLFIGGAQSTLDVQRRQLDVAQQSLDLNRRIASVMEASWR